MNIYNKFKFSNIIKYDSVDNIMLEQNYLTGTKQILHIILSRKQFKIMLPNMFYTARA